MLQTASKISTNWKFKVYNLLADLLEYPENDDFKQKTKECLDILKNEDKKNLVILEKFFLNIKDKSLEQMQEFYTHTFDLGAFAPIYIGYHLFGESYDRSKILVALRAIYKVKNIDEKGELPDFLPSVLRFIAHYSGSENEQEIMEK